MEPKKDDKIKDSFLHDKNYWKDESQENEEPFFEKHKGTFIFLGIIAFFVGYILFEYFFMDTSLPDCAYTETGCPGNNKYGQ